MLQRLMTEVMNIHFGPRTTVSEVNVRKEDRWRERTKVKIRTGRTGTTEWKTCASAWPTALGKMEKELALSKLVHLHCAGQEYKFGFFRTALLNSPHLDKTTILLSVQTVSVQCQRGDFCLVGHYLQYEFQDMLVTLSTYFLSYIW